MKLRPAAAALLLVLLPAACSSARPYVTTIGALRPDSTMTVRVGDAPLSAYQPATGQAGDRFTVAATAGRGTPPPAPAVRIGSGGITVSAPSKLAALLVRVPDRVNLVVDSSRGDVNVIDITGNATVRAKHGNVTVMLNGYAQASSARGKLTVMMGSTDWPGTLLFRTGRGDIDVHVNAQAAFAVHLHTDDGTLFSDFDLRGTSHGDAETIDGTVNGGGGRAIDIEARTGSIRLLQLHPQP